MTGEEKAEGEGEWDLKRKIDERDQYCVFDRSVVRLQLEVRK